MQRKTLFFFPTKTSLVAQTVKRLPTMWQTWVQSLDWKDLLEKEMATHSQFLPGKSHGRRNPVGYSPWGHRESDTTEQLYFSHNDTKPQTQLEWGLCKSNWYFEEEVRCFCSQFSIVTLGTSRYAINSCLWKNSKSSPRSLQLEKSPCRNKDPMQPKTKTNKQQKKFSDSYCWALLIQCIFNISMLATTMVLWAGS